MRFANNADHRGSDSNFEQAGHESGSNLLRLIHRLKLCSGENSQSVTFLSKNWMENF